MSSYQITGGATYHARALLNYSRWQPLREWVSEHLYQAKNLQDHLVLVGPSGGWSLPKKGFFEHFQTVSVYDPDPIAKKIFGLRFQLSTHWYNQDFFLHDGSGLQQWPTDRTYLFCNVLGQLGLLYKKSWPLYETVFKNNFSQFLETHHWLSYHDVYSMDAVAHHSRYKDLRNFIELENPQGEIVDHLTKDFFCTAHDHLFSWQLSSKRVHLLGWQSSEVPHGR